MINADADDMEGVDEDDGDYQLQSPSPSLQRFEGLQQPSSPEQPNVRPGESFDIDIALAWMLNIGDNAKDSVSRGGAGEMKTSKV